MKGPVNNLRRQVVAAHNLTKTIQPLPHNSFVFEVSTENVIHVLQ